MIQYALQDADGNELNLATSAEFSSIFKNSLTFDSEDFSWENKLAERSALPGAVKLGDTRLERRELVFNYTTAVGEDSDAYRQDENTLLLWLNKTEYLVDKSNSIQTRVVIVSHEPSYDSGGHKMSGEGQFVLLMLDPFWEDITATTDSESIAAATETDIALSNDGFLDVPPIFTLIASSAVTSIEISVVETNQGIEILDDLFGNPGFTQMDIDMKAGTVTIGELDRRNKITAGTGFFQFPVGSFTLRVETSAAVDLDTDWNERYYL
jgi:hypothetical protein